jgi:glycosyltransferase involved in cell wall biosynthesis
MSDRNPSVSIGIPVFNGEAFLAETLDSLLNQTLCDFEIVISDNASTDGTERICRAYAARDPRIHYFKNEVNRGAAWNYNRVFELSRGHYFKWNSADDVCAPEFLARCVAALDEDPHAVMAISGVAEIDENGTRLSSVTVPGQTLLPVMPSSASSHVRFRQVLRPDHLCIAVFSLIRSAILRRTDLTGGYADADRVLIAHLVLFGHCAVIPDVLLFSRDHAGRFTRTYRADYEGSRERTAWFDPLTAKRKVFPHWKKLSNLWRIVGRSPLTWQARLRCYCEVMRWASRRDTLVNLCWDAMHYPMGDAFRLFPRAKAVWDFFFREASRLAGKPLPSPHRIQYKQSAQGIDDSRAAAPAVSLPIERGEHASARLDVVRPTSAQLDITTILCAWNGAETLATTLQSLAGSRLPDGLAWEVLVVHNNANNKARDVVEKFCRQYPQRFRHLFEPTTGKSHALNSGIANARGEILAFVDEGLTVEPRWLQNLTAELGNGETIGAGGRVLPEPSFTPPSWLSWQQWKHCGGVLGAHFDLGDQPFDLDRPPHGANMAFRKSAFEKYGGFRLDLGPNPDGQVRNEVAEFGRRLLAAGERLRYEPMAVAYHSVPEATLSQQFFLSWWFDYGRASMRESVRPPNSSFPYDSVRLLWRAVAIPIMGLPWILAIRPHKRFFHKCMVWRQAGMLTELYGRLLPAKASKSTAA